MRIELMNGILFIFCRELDKDSENLQCANTDIDWLKKDVKPIYSSSVQGLLRTKIEAGCDKVPEI